MLELLRDETYIRYWLAVVISFLGDAMSKITLIYVAATVTDEPVVFISLVIIAQLLPSGVLGAFIGPLADRLPKRVLLIGADLARVVIVLAMIAALHSMWLLLALILLEGVGKAFFETARMAAIPKIVGKHSIPTAVALFQSTNNVINLVGPAFGGILIAIGNVTMVLGINAATFLVSALLLGSMAVLREVPVGTGAAQSYWQAMAHGMREVLKVPSLRVLMAVMVPVMLVLGLFTTNLNAQLLTVFHLPAAQYGLAQGVFGGAAIMAALFGPRLIKRYTSANGLLMGSVALFGVSLLLLAPTDWLHDQLGVAVVMAWCLLAGFGSSLFQVPVANTMLRDLPEEVRGRGIGLINALIINFSIIGVAIGSITGSLLGIANSIIVAGAVLLLAAGAFMLPARTAAPQAPEVKVTGGS